MQSAFSQTLVKLWIFFSIAALLPAMAGQDIRFSDGWKFYLGDATNAQQPSFSDGSWASVYLPHTPRIELNDATSSIYMGVCWYRKSFTPGPSLQGKKIFLEFQGAMQTAQVYINGSLAATHLGGYTPIVLDITSLTTFGSANIIAVRLDNNASISYPPGSNDVDFLYFGGLYRDAYLHCTDSLHISNAILANIPGGGGIAVSYPSVSASSATVQVKTHVVNESKSSRSCVLTTVLFTSAGQQAGTSSTTQAIAAGASFSFTQSINVTNPQLWHPDHPNLYTVRSQVFDNTRLADTASTVIGIRTISFSKANGFQINGQRLIFRGANRHQAYPYIGNSAPASAQYRDALRLKEYGFNFVRMSHYTQSQSFVDACDKLGIMGSACLPGWQYFSTSADFSSNSAAALRDMMRWYRNHPSVILWESMPNESSPSTAYLTAMQSAAKEEIPGGYTAGEEGNNILDVFISSSQHGVRSYAGSRPCVISEYGDWDIGPCLFQDPITGCADRVSRSDGEAAMLTQAFNMDTSLSANRALSWLSGDALWSAFDYQTWNYDPLTTSGALDIFRIPKYAAYFFQSQRSPTVMLPGVNLGPMVFIASQWTASSSKTVRVFSNCEQVSLYLNGSLVATQSPITGSRVEHPRFEFSIPSFQSGTLKANGLIGGAVAATHSVTTPLAASKLAVTIDTAGLPFAADGSDIAIVYASVQDANGTTVPTAANSVTFSVIAGQADLIGVNPVAAQAGIAAILLRSGTAPGAITVNAAATDLTGGSSSVAVVSTPSTQAASGWTASSRTARMEARLRRVGSMLIVEIARRADYKQQGGVLTLCNARGERVGRWSGMNNGDAINLSVFPHGVYACHLSVGNIRSGQKILW